VGLKDSELVLLEGDQQQYLKLFQRKIPRAGVCIGASSGSG